MKLWLVLIDTKNIRDIIFIVTIFRIIQNIAENLLYYNDKQGD